ncbi:ribosome maturation factor RimM [Stygiobacter electus]|uniref:Ribosome maturation factor RimM n=1 Tax=Stygiobacter electus TaxID=3032292 RepID=A0AAE3NYH4_9BACT|nr:ribosome maturation factor RimM [Stygiobacter electus]MDF1610925.1 ribosome maturation factor RimM [Stygiobacter electus]
MDDLFLIAEVKSAFGTEGYVLIDSFSDFKDRFFELQKVFVQIFGNYKELIVESVKEIDNKIILKFKGFNSSSDVEIFLNQKLFVDKENVVRLEKDTFFIHDLIGCQVFRNEIIIGFVNDVLVLPANDVLEIKNDEKVILVPFVKDFIQNIQVENKLIELKKDCDLLYDDED